MANSHHAGSRLGKRRERKGEDDFRWRQQKKLRNRQRDEPSADSLREEPRVAPEGPKEASRDIKHRQKEARKRRHVKHDAQREADDSLIRGAPHSFLWSKYVDWAGNKLTDVERIAEKWEGKSVTVIEDEGENIMPKIKEICGGDYRTKTGWQKGNTAGVGVILLTMSALHATKISKSVYDGLPVGKLFGKHSGIEMQKDWLKRASGRALIPTVVGTAKRIGRFVEDGDLILTHTSALVVDFARDSNLRNVLDINTTCVEFFKFLHDHGRQCINDGTMKVILRIPKTQPTKVSELIENRLATIRAGNKNANRKKNMSSGSENISH